MGSSTVLPDVASHLRLNCKVTAMGRGTARSERSAGRNQSGTDVHFSIP